MTACGALLRTVLEKELAPYRDDQAHRFGTRLIIGGVSRELGGTVRLDFAAAGLRCSLHHPLDEPDRFTSFSEGAGAQPVGTS